MLDNSPLEKQVEKLNPHTISIPGIGTMTAGVVLGEMGDLNRFDSISQVTAYSCLDPSVMDSGHSHRTGYIS